MIQDSLFIDNTPPFPITKEQTYEYFEQFYNGDKKAREKIIEHNIRLVLYEVSKKFSNFKYDQKDLVSVGIVGLIKSVDTFDTSKSYEFATYATRCIDNEILMFIRKNKKHIGNYSFEDLVIKFEDGGNINLEEKLAQDEDFATELEDKETNELVKMAIEKLPKLEREVVRLYYGVGDGINYAQKDIAEKLNYSQSSISKMLRSGLLKMKILLKELGEDNVKQDFSSEIKKKVLE